MLPQFIKIGYWKCWEKAAEQSCCAEVLARERRGMFDNVKRGMLLLTEQNFKHQRLQDCNLYQVGTGTES